MVTIAVAVEVSVAGVTAVIVHVANVAGAVITIVPLQVVVYFATFTAGGVNVTVNGVDGAVLDVNVTVEEPPVLLLSVVGAAATLTVGATALSVTVTIEVPEPMVAPTSVVMAPSIIVPVAVA